MVFFKEITNFSWFYGRKLFWSKELFWVRSYPATKEWEIAPLFLIITFQKWCPGPLKRHSWSVQLATSLFRFLKYLCASQRDRERICNCKYFLIKWLERKEEDTGELPENSPSLSQFVFIVATPLSYIWFLPIKIYNKFRDMWKIFEIISCLKDVEYFLVVLYFSLHLA